MEKILIIIDMQNDFTRGALANPDAVAIIPAIKDKIIEYREAGHQIIFTRDTHLAETYLSSNEGKHLPVPHCIYGTPGWEVVDELWREAPEVDFGVINKTSFGYDWYGYFGDVDNSELEIELVGTCTDICVVSNALGLKIAYPEAKIIVDASCCAGLTPEKHAAALETMKSCQVEVINE